MVFSLIAGITIFFSIDTIISLKDNFSRVTDETMPVIKSLEDLRFAALRIVSSTHEFGLIIAETKTADKAEKNQERKEENHIKSAKELYENALKRYEYLTNMNSPGKRDHVKNVHEAGQHFLQLSEQFIEMKEHGSAGLEILEIMKQFENAKIFFLNTINMHLDQEGKELQERRAKVASMYGNAIKTIFIVSGTTFFMALISSLIMSVFITRPIEKLKLAAAMIGQGALDTKVDIRSNDEIGELARSFNKMTCDLKKSRDELSSTTERLKQSNKELHEFLFIASHDLQEPLRKVMVFGDRLKDTDSEILSEKGRDYIERMQNTTRRMQVLINDLLSFARVSINTKPFIPVDLSMVAKNVTTDIKALIKQTGGSVEVKELAALDANPVQMHQLFFNIIDNALKFRKKNEPPVVTVQGAYIPKNGADQSSSSNECGLYQITIEDNGIGFDEKYAERIFRVFQRLHARNEYSGTGIGLSVCKKIVERHGGSISAKSAPGDGTKLIVTLPVKQSNGG